MQVRSPSRQWFIALLTVLVLAFTAPPSAAQQPRSRPYLATATTSQTVSPYLNLGVDANGLSNYPSLVRPLLEQREMLARQTASDPRARGQSRGGRPSRTGNAAPADARDSGPDSRFMNYSHYYRSAR